MQCGVALMLSLEKTLESQTLSLALFSCEILSWHQASKLLTYRYPPAAILSIHYSVTTHASTFLLLIFLLFGNIGLCLCCALLPPHSHQQGHLRSTAITWAYRAHFPKFSLMPLELIYLFLWNLQCTIVTHCFLYSYLVPYYDYLYMFSVFSFCTC